MMRRVLIVLLLVLVLLAIGLYGLANGWFGRREPVGTITAAPRPAPVVARRTETQQAASRRLGVEVPKQILFGDFHVHTTFSSDAFLFSLPLLQGEGAHPPADACDFARYCSALDFWSINDHAEALTPRTWSETIASVRQCNAVAGDPANPDVVAYLGWEWTQLSTAPERHYGHKNVVLRDLTDDAIPRRPIASPRHPGSPKRLAATLALLARDRRTLDYTTYVAELSARERCPEGIPVRELPADCLEVAPTPADLFAKLDDWGYAALVIPHGTAWGWTAPALADWRLQVEAAQFENDRQGLVEIYSGHGNSEEYRDFRPAVRGPDGSPTCPQPTPDYVAGCWRAGEIVAERCRAEGTAEAECAEREVEARRLFLEAGRSGVRSVPGSTAEDWLDSGQCPDCFQPAFDYRPTMSVQYALALREFDADGAARGYRFGFLGSSDTHTARAGSGYKEFARHRMADVAGASERAQGLIGGPADPEARAVRVGDGAGYFGRDVERVVSFLYTGGLVAVHARGRDREAIWDALERREIYGTSGPRILLWFELLNGPAGEAAMGSEVELAEVPEFRVRAAGSLVQRPGCPEHVVSALPPERLAHLCRGECYNPSDERRRITRIEVVRIRPQVRRDEPVGSLIDDPWRVFPCSGDRDGCEVSFRDEEYAALGRDLLYYARAIEEPSPAVNAGNLRCRRDESGRCVDVQPCYGDARTNFDDDCLTRTEPRAWSSPIFLVHPAEG